MSASDAVTHVGVPRAEEPAASRPRRGGDFDRLAAAIETFRAEVRARAAAVPGSWVDEANRLLDRAAELDSAEAWTYYQAAVRHAVDGLTPAAVWNEQQVLLAEAREKLSGWRRDAVTSLLLEPAGGTTPRKDELMVLAGAIGGDPAVLPLAGAAAGTAAVPLASAGVIPVEHTIGATLAVAFVSGFSERLIVRAAEAFPGSRSGAPAA